MTFCCEDDFCVDPNAAVCLAMRTNLRNGTCGCPCHDVAGERARQEESDWIACAVRAERRA